MESCREDVHGSSIRVRRRLHWYVHLTKCVLDGISRSIIVEAIVKGVTEVVKYDAGP
jgi:hypothetical protein